MLQVRRAKQGRLEPPGTLARRVPLELPEQRVPPGTLVLQVRRAKQGRRGPLELPELPEQRVPPGMLAQRVRPGPPEPLALRVPRA